MFEISWPRAAAAALVSVLLALAGVGTAVADTVTANSPQFQVVAGQRTLTLGAGATQAVSLSYAATNGDVTAGCNLKRQGADLVLNVVVTPTAPAGAGGLQVPSQVTFKTCGDVLAMNVKALIPGTYSLGLSYVSGPEGTTASDYDLSEASFVVTVPDLDTTPPSVTYQLSPQPNASGWNNSDVTVDWTVNDPQSPVSSASGCDDTTVTTNTAADGLTFTCTATSAGGTTQRGVTVRLDKAAPVVTPVVRGQQGDNGWYTGDVTVGWTISDDGSSTVATQSADCAGATLASDTQSQTYSCTVTDKAGNSTMATTTVKRDATEPVITKVVSGTPGASGWFTADTSVDWTVSDATSDLSTSTACDDATLREDSAATTYDCTAVDNAGNTATDSVTLKRDATPPTISPTIDGTEGQNGWYTSDVVVSWTLDDNLSGVDATTADGCATRTIAADTAATGVTLTCSVKDNAGNVQSDSVTIKRDAAMPTITHAITGTEGQQGWYTGDAGISWQWTDGDGNGSGIGTTLDCDPVTQSAETDGTTYTCFVTDLAGNEASDEVTVKLDKSGPDITPRVEGTRGKNGWFVSDSVGLSWTLNDKLSGLDADAVLLGCGAETVTEDTPADTFTCKVRDVAGNVATASYTIKKDSTSPTVTAVPEGTPGLHGWYTSAVHLSWALQDPTSGVIQDSATGCGYTTIAHETAGDDFTCTVEDEAGNIGKASTTVNIDTTAPQVAPGITGKQGNDGWYIGDVGVSWVVSDSGSGMTDGSRLTGCDDSVLTTDTVKQDYTCTATDVAGNSTSATTTVKRDATRPVISKTISGPEGSGGWYTGDVSVDWTVSDTTSGLSPATDCADRTLAEDSAGTTYECHAVDNAGNKADDAVRLMRDATVPTVTPHVVGTKGNGEWYTGDVSVDWSFSDDLSGVAGTNGCGHQDVTADTTGTTFTCQVEDQAGNVSAESVTIHRDATAPQASAGIEGNLGQNGWYVGDVTVNWTPSDATSGVDEAATSCPDGHQVADTTGTEFTCTTTDQAGNTHVDKVTVKRDTVAPAITWTGGPADGASYDFGDPIPAASCSADDSTSGVDDQSCQVTGVAGTAAGQSYTLTATATDKAGNRTIVAHTYRVNPWSLDGFYKPVDMGVGVLNVVKAGSTVPLKFNVLKGGTPMSSGIGATFTAKKMNCDTGGLLNDSTDFATTGSTSLRWDSAGQQWIQNWSTPTSGKGSCYLVSMTTQDLSSISATFKLK